jgi:hypothetical protein
MKICQLLLTGTHTNISEALNYYVKHGKERKIVFLGVNVDFKSESQYGTKH